MIQHYPTKHAVQAMSTRDVAWAEVLWVLSAPEVQYHNVQRNTGIKSTVNQRGSLYVITAFTPEFDRHDTDKATPMYAVITVGLRAQHQWNNGDARDRVLTQEKP